MEERFRVWEECGRDELDREIEVLKDHGYKIMSVMHGKMPFCMGRDGLPVMADGWEVVAERPPLSEAPRGLWG